MGWLRIDNALLNQLRINVLELLLRCRWVRHLGWHHVLNGESIIFPIESFIGIPTKLHRFSMISRFLEGILMEHIDMKSTLDSKLQIDYICSIRIRTRNQDIVEKLYVNRGSKLASAVFQ